MPAVALLPLLINIGLSIGLSLLNSLLAGKPKSNLGRQERKFTVRSAAAPRQVVYGETLMKDPVLLHIETSNSDRHLWMFLGYAGHEVESFEGFWFNDEEVGARAANGVVSEGKFKDKVVIRTFLGTDDQTADNLAITNLSDWSSTDRFQGIAYAMVRLTADVTLFPQIPEVRALIKGKKVRHYATPGTAWTNNAALIALDYLLGAHGFEADPALVSEAEAAFDELVCDEMAGVVETSFAIEVDTDLAELTLDKPGCRTGDKVAFPDAAPTPLDPASSYYWIKTGDDKGQLAASLKDARAGLALQLTGAGDATAMVRQAQPRYTTNGSFLTDEIPLDVMEDLLSTMASRPALNASGYAIRPGRDVAAVGGLTTDQLRDPLQVSTRRPVQDRFSTVVGTFKDADQLWADTEFDAQASTVFAAQDGGARVSDLDMDFVDDKQRAQRLAQIHLAQSRQMIVLEWPGDMSCIQYERGDVVPVTVAELGFDAKPFYVARDKFADGGFGYDMTLVEVADGLFDTDLDGIEARDPALNTYLSPSGAIDPPAGISFLTRPVAAATGELVYLVDLFGDASPDFAATHYDAHLFDAGDSAFAQPVATASCVVDPALEEPPRMTLGPVGPTLELVLRLRARTWRGNVSAWVTSDAFVAAAETGGDGGGTAPSPGDAPGAPTGLANSKEVTGVSGGFAGVGEITFTGGGGTGAQALGAYTESGGLPTYTFDVVTPGRGYTTAPTVTAGTGSAAETGTATIGNPDRAHLNWTDDTDTDLATVEIWRADTDSSAAAIKVSEVRAGAEQADPRLTCAVSSSQFFFLRSVDASGNVSGFTSSVEVTRTA